MSLKDDLARLAGIQPIGTNAPPSSPNSTSTQLVRYTTTLRTTLPAWDGSPNPTPTTLLDLGSGSQFDVTIYLVGITNMPVSTAPNDNTLLINFMNWSSASELSNYSLDTDNPVLSVHNKKLQQLLVTNYYTQPVTFITIYTAKTVDNTKEEQVANIQQIIGTVNVLSIQNVANQIPGTITAANGSVVAANISNYPTCLVSFKGTYGPATVQFSISDDNGLTYYETNAYEMTSGLASAEWDLPPVYTPNDIFYVPILGATNLRVLATAFTTGTISIIITPIGTTASEYISTGQQTMARSSPVVLAVDEVVPVTSNPNQPLYISETDYDNIYTTQLSISTTASQLPSNIQRVMIVKNDDNSSDDIFIGNSTVSTTNGFRLQPGQGIVVALGNPSIVYAVTGSGTATLDLLEFL